MRVAEAREQVLQAQLGQVVARVGELGRELVELSPGQRLYTFIAERAASEDYRRELGLIATIRHDFERLARLQDEWRRNKDGASPRPIDRIVLYIDDLDRCTPRQVVRYCNPSTSFWPSTCSSWSSGSTPDGCCIPSATNTEARSQRRPLDETASAAEAAAAETPRGRDESIVREDADRLML